MDEQVSKLVTKAWDLYQKLEPSSRLLIAISGIPGSGKTSLASKVSSQINALHHSTYHTLHPNNPGTVPIVPDISTPVPLDGYHLTRAELDQLSNPSEAHFRRGAPFTFNGPAYLSLVQQLRSPLLPETPTTFAPSFDHAIKDPVDNDIPIPATSRIIIFEGNYLALNQEPWNSAADLMDQIWFVDVSPSVAIERLVTRHVAAGMSPSKDHARMRVVESDMRNGDEILKHKVRNIDEVIKSEEDPEWASSNKGEEVARKLEDGRPDEIGMNGTTARAEKMIDKEGGVGDTSKKEEVLVEECTEEGLSSARTLAENGGGC